MTIGAAEFQVGTTAGPKIMTGAVDPSAGAGIVAPLGSVYYRTQSGSVQTWQKTDVANADWTLMSSSTAGIVEVDVTAPITGGGTSSVITIGIDAATDAAAGSMSAADKTKLDGLPTSAVPTSRTLTAGTGMTGGGDLSANRTFNVAANADGSISANAHDIQVGVLATDAQHGARGGGTQHAGVVAAGAAGFMSGADKTKLDGLPSSAVPATRTLTAGAGLTGGGDLSADRTFDVAANADGSIQVNAHDVQVGVLATDAQHGTRGGGTQHPAAVASGASGFLTGADKEKLDGLPTSAVPTTRTLTAGTGMTGGGDLSADRTFNVAANADGSILANAHDVQVGVLATDAQHGNRGGGGIHANVVAAGAAGFMTGADKTKLDGIAAGATDTPLATLAPVNVTKSAAAAGAGTTAARDDHKHDVSTAIAGLTVPGNAAAEGTATTLARSDHQHGIAAFGSSPNTFCQGNDPRLLPSPAVDGFFLGSSGTTPTWEEPLIPDTATFYLKDSAVESSALTTTQTGTGALGAVLQADAVLPGLFNATTGSTTTGRGSRAWQMSTNAWCLSASSRKMTYKYVGWQMPVLSGAADIAVTRWGFCDLVTGTPQDGVYFEFDANANANVLTVTSANSVRTATTSAFAPVAGSFYDWKIVITNNTTVSYYVRANGPAGGAWTLVGTNTSNIPSGVTRGFGFGLTIIKNGGATGTTPITLAYQTQLAYQE